ncbi:hypothetical protein NRV55_000265 [Staphylococcus pseudintermedius]|nr:hypothetical protein [Staphylococcus pseudintermedius]
MKLFILGAIIIIIIAVILYLLLSYLMNVFSHLEKKHEILNKAKESKKEQKLMEAELKTRQRILEQQIRTKVGMFYPMDEIRRLENELEQVNQTLDEIKNGGNI